LAEANCWSRAEVGPHQLTRASAEVRAMVNPCSLVRCRKRGVYLMGVVCASVLLHCPLPSIPAAFISAPRQGSLQSHRLKSGDTEQPLSLGVSASSSATAAGLLPLVAAPAASLAMGWETAIVGPLGIVETVLNLFKFCLGIYALLSWLSAFGIVDLRNDIVQKVQGVLSSIIEPVLAPLRSVIPPLGGFDISFMVLWFVVEQAQAAATTIIFGAMTYDTYY